MIIRRISPKIAQKKVAAYARVSTLNEAQEESYETQVAYYRSLIKSKEEWELADIYADQGTTGTSAAKRPDFLRMIADAAAGKIDIILCKSISRFSRNFVEAQKYVHELKAINVEVRFEKEGLSSFDPSSDMIFSTLAAIAQEESRSISENVKWSNRRKAEMGIRHVGSNHMMGYDEIDGKLTPNRDAWIVKLIFEEYAAGEAPSLIIRHLTEKGAHRMRSDKEFKWAVILNILNNEAYVGDRLLQKTAPQNYLTKKPDPTEAYDSIYISNDHEPIISRAVWEAVQERFAKQKKIREQGLSMRRTAHFLYGKVFCAECGEPYRRCTAKDKNGHYRTWRCRKRMKTGDCTCRHIRETELLHEISDALGWTWQGDDAFDTQAFMKRVDRVIVSGSRVDVIEVSDEETIERDMESA